MIAPAFFGPKTSATYAGMTANNPPNVDTTNRVPPQNAAWQQQIE